MANHRRLASCETAVEYMATSARAQKREGCLRPSSSEAIASLILRFTLLPGRCEALVLLLWPRFLGTELSLAKVRAGWARMSEG